MQSKKAEIKGALNTHLAQMSEEFGVDSLESAEEMYQDLEEEEKVLTTDCKVEYDNLKEQIDRIG